MIRAKLELHELILAGASISIDRDDFIFGSGSAAHGICGVFLVDLYDVIILCGSGDGYGDGVCFGIAVGAGRRDGSGVGYLGAVTPGLIYSIYGVTWGWGVGYGDAAGSEMGRWCGCGLRGEIFKWI